MGELLGAAAWAGKIYSGGWVDGGGHTFASVEPATGRQLRVTGVHTDALTGQHGLIGQ